MGRGWEATKSQWKDEPFDLNDASLFGQNVLHIGLQRWELLIQFCQDATLYWCLHLSLAADQLFRESSPNLSLDRFLQFSWFYALKFIFNQNESSSKRWFQSRSGVLFHHLADKEQKRRNDETASKVQFYPLPLNIDYRSSCAQFVSISIAELLLLFWSYWAIAWSCPPEF